MKLSVLEKAVGRALTLIAEGGLSTYGAYPTKSQYRGDAKGYAEAATAKAQVYAVALSESEATIEAIEETAKRYLLRKVLVNTGDGGMAPAGEFPSAPAFAFAVRQTMGLMYMHLPIEMPDRSVLLVRVPRDMPEDQQRAMVAAKRDELGLPEVQSPALEARPVRSEEDQAETLMAQVAEMRRMRQTA